MKNNKILNSCFYIAVFFISASLNAQSINIGNPAQTLTSQVEKWFPWIAGIIFLFVAFKNLGNLVNEGGDPWKGIKNLILYCLIVAAVVGIYKWVKTQSL